MLELEPEYVLAWLLALFLSTLFTYLTYSGLFTRVEVRTSETPYGPMVIAYKARTGPYRTAGELYTESYCLLPNRQQVGIYYDDPQAIPETDLRFAVGPILSPGPDSPALPSEMELMTRHGFRIAHLPKPSYVVSALFPFRTTLSIHIAIFRIYPKMRQYITQRNLCAYPALEIYRDDTIEFLMPLSRQDEFFVQEFQEEAVSVATTADLGSVAGAEETDGAMHRDESVFLRPRTPPRRNDRHPVRTATTEQEDDDNQSEESENDSASGTTTSSFDDLSKDIEDKVRNS